MDDVGRRLDGFRAYLRLLARTQLGIGLQPRVDASDLVQQTLADAHAQWDEFRGSDDAQLAAWLRAILAGNVADAVRAAHRAKRDVGREVARQALEESCSRLAACAAAVQTSPSGRAMRNEDLLALAVALERLPEEQRAAVELHHLQGLTLSETAEAMDRTDASVAGLLRRGLRRLRELLAEPDGGAP